MEKKGRRKGGGGEGLVAADPKAGQQKWCTINFNELQFALDAGGEGEQRAKAGCKSLSKQQKGGPKIQSEREREIEKGGRDVGRRSECKRK